MCEEARERTHVKTPVRAARLHVREVTHVGEYLRYLWAIFPIQLLLSKPLPVQHVRNKKLDKIISTSRHGFDSLKLVKSYGAGIRGILFYFLSLRAPALSFSLSLFLSLLLSLTLSRLLFFSLFFVPSPFFRCPFFCYPSVETPDARPGIDPPRAHKSAIFVRAGDLSRFLLTISEGFAFDSILYGRNYVSLSRKQFRALLCLLESYLEAQQNM